MDKKYELVIIGGGPAGITAGIYAGRRRIKTLLIAKAFGGQMARKSVAIENYPGLESISGIDLIKKMVDQLKANGVEVLSEEVTKVQKEGSEFTIKTESGEEIESSAIIVATGADPRPLNVPGEKEYIGKGVSYCTTCDAPMFIGKDIAVIGGGNSGFESALSMKSYAKKIYILEASEKIAADRDSQEKAAKSDNIEIITSAIVKRIEGDKFVRSLVFEDKKEGKEKTLLVEGVFVEIGNTPAAGFIKDLVEFNNRGEIMIDHRTGETKTEGIFAAGDVADLKYKQIVIACGEGTKALLSASNYLDNKI
jgi:thioredoxin-disulfide reductase